MCRLLAGFFRSKENGETQRGMMDGVWFNGAGPAERAAPARTSIKSSDVLWIKITFLDGT